MKKYPHCLEEILHFAKVCRYCSKRQKVTSYSTSSFVSSVLKRKHERDVLFDEIRNQHYPSKISKMALKYFTFD